MWITSCAGSVCRGFWGFEKKSESRDLVSEEDGWFSELFEALPQVSHVLVVGGADGKVVIERLCLALLYVEKPLNSKVIKSVVPKLRRRKCFFVFRDSYVIYVCPLWTWWTFCEPVWICLFHVFVYGYVTLSLTWMNKITPLFFYKDCFGVKSSTKLDMPLKKETKPSLCRIFDIMIETPDFNILIYSGIHVCEKDYE